MPDRPPPGGVAFREAGRSCGHSGHFASEVEFSKGYRHFASVITLAKCGSAVKAEVSLRKWDPSCRYRCENSPWRAAPGPGRPEATRYSRQNGPRAASTFQRDALGQETTHWGRQFAYPNALLPTPMREGTPRCLPQCPVAYPNAGRHTTLPAPMRAHARPLRFRRPGSCGLHCESGRGWSKMRLSLAVFGGLRTGVVRNASGFDGFGRIRVDSVRLRRFLDHMPVKPPFPPETQTHFGPPDRWGTGPLGHRASTGRGLRPPHAESTRR